MEKEDIKQSKDEENKNHPETLLANQVSIMDFVRKNNFVIRYEDEKIAKIQDVISEEDITVFKDNNTWSVPENGTTTGGRTIRFVARMQEMSTYAASDMLVENRAKYQSSKEYNDEYAKQHGKQIEENVTEKDKTVTQKGRSELSAKDEKDVEQEVNNEVPKPTHFTKLQMAEILSGAKRGLDIKVFDKIELSPEQMRELRIGLENDVNLSKFAYKQVPADYMKEVRLAAQDGLDLKVFALKKKECVYTAEQAREIRLGLMFGLNQEQMKVYLKKDLKPDVMRELRLGLQDGFEVIADFSNGLYTAKDIHTVRMHLTVKQLIDSFKEKLELIFRQFREAIRISISKQNPELSMQESQDEADLQVKDTVRNLYEAIEDQIAEKDVETKKAILSGVFDKIIAIGNAIEKIYPDQEKAEIYQQTVAQVEEAFQEKSLISKALEALKMDYAEKFAQSEQTYNIQIAEITESLMNEPKLSAEQKKEILMNNLNYEMSEVAIDNMIEYSTPEKQVVDNCTMTQYQQEILEYFEEFEMEQ